MMATPMCAIHPRSEFEKLKAPSAIANRQPELRSTPDDLFMKQTIDVKEAERLPATWMRSSSPARIGNSDTRLTR